MKESFVLFHPLDRGLYEKLVSTTYPFSAAAFCIVPGFILDSATPEVPSQVRLTPQQ
jgi:hypothetical protein